VSASHSVPHDGAIDTFSFVRVSIFAYNNNKHSAGERKLPSGTVSRRGVKAYTSIPIAYHVRNTAAAVDSRFLISISRESSLPPVFSPYPVKRFPQTSFSRPIAFAARHKKKNTPNKTNRVFSCFLSQRIVYVYYACTFREQYFGSRARNENLAIGRVVSYDTTWISVRAPKLFGIKIFRA